ncbi:MAG: hypothetical protein QM698_05720 [Micropepsaceae bacterium]
MIRTAIAAAALVFGLAAPAAAAPMIVAPPEAAVADAPLNALLETLIKAAEARDFAPFEAALTPTATASFGGDEGPEGFRRAYGIDQPDSPFWPEFIKAAKLGGAFLQDDLFVVPYIAANMPEEADPYLSVIAIGEKTMLYAEPKEGAAAIADVTHQVLEQIDIEPADLEKTGPDFVHVKADAGAGYVRIGEVRSALDYRAVFEKRDGVWKLTAFVAGD